MVGANMMGARYGGSIQEGFQQGFFGKCMCYERNFRYWIPTHVGISRSHNTPFVYTWACRRLNYLILGAWEVAGATTRGRQVYSVIVISK